MTKEKFKDFIEENKIEYHWHDNDGFPDVYICLSDYLFDDFRKLLDYSIYDDNGVKVILRHDYLVIFMADIVEYYGVELEEVFEERCPYV